MLQFWRLTWRWGSRPQHAAPVPNAHRCMRIPSRVRARSGPFRADLRKGARPPPGVDGWAQGARMLLCAPAPGGGGQPRSVRLAGASPVAPCSRRCSPHLPLSHPAARLLCRSVGLAGSPRPSQPRLGHCSAPVRVPMVFSLAWGFAFGPGVVSSPEWSQGAVCFSSAQWPLRTCC